MALDGVFRMKGATPKDMNEVACNLINNEKKHLPAPRIGCEPDINAAKIARTWITRPPIKRHQDAIAARLVIGVNEKNHILDMQSVMGGRKYSDPTLSTSSYFEKEHDPLLEKLREECDRKIAQKKQPAMDRYCLPLTSAGEVGRLAVNPLDPKWRRSEGPGHTWRFPKDECDIVLFGKKFYETTGVNMFSKAAQNGLFNGIPS